MSERNTAISKNELITVIVVSLLYIGGVMCILRIPWCGYHLVDDHEFTAWTYLLRAEHRSLTQMISDYMHANIASGRWRPLYLIMRGVFIYIFGDNITLYYIWAIIKTSITFVLIYYLAKLMGGSIAASYMCSFIALTGYQSAAWWKLGTHEIVSTMWFVLGMILMIRYLQLCQSKQHSSAWTITVPSKTVISLYAVGSVLSFLCMSMYKETFLILMPFAILYVFYQNMRSPHSAEDTTIADSPHEILMGFKRTLHDHWLYLSILTLIL